MRIALTHNLRLSDSPDEAEFDSPESVEALTRALEAAGHEVEPIEVSGPASRVVSRLEAYSPDLIFNRAEGRRGRYREAFYPALFEELGFPYTAADAHTCALTLDKAWTKKVLTGYGVPSPRGRVFTVDDLDGGGLDDLPFPVIVKPNYEGSSKGIDEGSVVDDPIDLARVIEERLAQFAAGVLVEEYVDGRDVAVPFLAGVGDGVLDPVEYVVDESGLSRRYNLLDYRLRNVEPGRISLRCPAVLPDRTAERLRAMMRRTVRALGLQDVCRADFRIARDGRPFFIEVDAIPGMDPAADVFAATQRAGLDYPASIQAVVEAACRRWKLQSKAKAPRGRASRDAGPLRVGLTFNLKRVNPAEDDAEAEYDSPRTIQAIAEAIESYGHKVVQLEATSELPRTLPDAAVDVVFNVAEGIRGRNREAQVPALCELLGVPYTGSDAATLSITLDKALCKRVLRQAGIPTPDFFIMATGRERIPKGWTFPAIVKPNLEGTSKGIGANSVVDDEASLRQRASELIERYRQPALVEIYVAGREFTIGLLGERRPRALPPMEIVFLQAGERPVYDYALKQDWAGKLDYVCPADVEPQVARAMERLARDTFATLGCRDVARVDIRVDHKGALHVLEVNPLPGLTPEFSDLVMIAEAAGIGYRQLIGEILSCGVKRLREARRAAHRGAIVSVPPPPPAAAASPPANGSSPSPSATVGPGGNGGVR